MHKPVKAFKKDWINNCGYMGFKYSLHYKAGIIRKIIRNP